MNKRLFVKKKPGFEVEAASLQENLKTDLNLADDFELELFNIYDVFNADEEDLTLLKEQVLAEPYIDEVLEVVEFDPQTCLAFEYLPGQYDQRADSAMQCLMLLNNKKDVRVHSGTFMRMKNISPEQMEAVAGYMINPVEARKKDLTILDDSQKAQIKDVPVFEDFRNLDAEGLETKRSEMGLAMSAADLKFVQDYFKNEEQRDPYETEIRVLDTYWSDHCRHTTFETVIEQADFQDPAYKEQLEKAWDEYLSLRKEVNREEKPVTLMDMAVIAKRVLHARGKLDDEEVSDEINACSIEIPVDVNGQEEPWLLMFKNETHNHPTEIEPFGGASTCIGGAIRDPLSGRSYVYQAVRITGAGDITAPVSETLEHKLPQSKISKTAAKGYSSYGNQIGLATTFVQEIFDPGYTAKRMEVGGVVGAAPKSHVKREKPQPGDLIVLIGGATGRDGIGGATGSSKEHTDHSLEECSSEVQKGNALVERKLQRLFRNPDATRLIKKANDFGAGGVSVAIGELADGLEINLDAVPVKYEGLYGTELAISESQERMAVCIDAADLDAFIKECEKENLSAVVAAEVIEEPRMKMNWRGTRIADMSRAFLDTNGVRQKTKARVEASGEPSPFNQKEDSLAALLQDPNIASQIGLAEMFDASIGKSTVLMPFGGKYQTTPEQASIQKLPVDGFTNTASWMTFGYDPALSRFSPYLGGMYSVVEALSKLAATGADTEKARLTNQEYFERLNKDPEKWGAPLQALLGLIQAEMAFETPAIGGKDSMSGTFNELHVPPTLITFAVQYGKTDQVISSAFKGAGHPLYLLRHTPNADFTADFEGLKANFQALKEQNQKGNILSARALSKGGAAAAAALMGFGSKTGFDLDLKDAYDYAPGSILVEAACEIDDPAFEKAGSTTDDGLYTINNKEELPLDEAFALWTKRYDALYPRTSTHNTHKEEKLETPLHTGEKRFSKVKVEKPRVLIPVFPGQNCEIDCAAQFKRAGGDVKTLVFNNLDVEHIAESIDQLAQEIEKANILMLAGGFSLGDEPDGSGKFIVTVLKNPKIKAALEKMRANEGLILGICNGFQALVKSGLLPLGEIGPASATLFRNDINRHVSHMARTRITSNKSPWLQGFKPGETFTVAMSHGEGKFVADPALLKQLEENGQIATQYVDENGVPSMNGTDNINGSMMAIEGVISPDGMILGKMGHSERWEEGLFQNIDGNLNQNIFENGIRFFTHQTEGSQQ